MKKNRINRQGQKGFTLIEIIAVLVIMGILAAVVAPRYFELTNNANQAAVRAAGAEVQARINQLFAQQLQVANGRCTTALAQVGSTNLTDDDGNVGGWTVAGAGWADPLAATNGVVAVTLTNAADTTITGAYNLRPPLCD